MRAFDSNIVGLLNDGCKSDEVHFIGLGLHDFQLSFGRIQRLQSTHRAAFCIAGELETWEGGPSEAPVWKLAGQRPSHFELVDPLILRLNFASGDYIEFHSEEGPYESVLIEFSSQGEAIVLEIY